MTYMRFVVANIIFLTHTYCIDLFDLLEWGRGWERRLRKISDGHLLLPKKKNPRFIGYFFVDTCRTVDNGETGPIVFACLLRLVCDHFHQDDQTEAFLLLSAQIRRPY